MPKRLPSYLEEFTLRFNRLASRRRGLVFHRLLEQAVVIGAATDAPRTRLSVGIAQWKVIGGANRSHH